MEKPKEQSEVGLDALVIFQNSIKTLRDLIKVQCSNGNWNYDPYMQGMANGMILALSLFDNKEPEYLEAFKIWLKDISSDGKPVESVSI